VSDIVAEQPAARTGGVIAGPRVVPFDAVPLAMLVADSSGGVLAVNDRWVELSGRPGVESLGEGWLESLDACSSARLRAAVGRAARMRAAVGRAAGGPAVVTVESLLAGRPSRWVLASYEWAGETLVGIAVETLGESRLAPVESRLAPVESRLAPAAGDLDAVLRELSSLCDDLDGLLGRLEAASA
jgi:hypothetical protein